MQVETVLGIRLLGVPQVLGLALVA
jgi:hypothetical protein